MLAQKRRKSPTERKQCANKDCRKTYVITEFYQSNSVMFPDGRVPICKKCLLKMVDETDVNSVINVLRQIDKPYIDKLWQSALNSDAESFGNYMKNINSLHQYKKMTFDDSEGLDTPIDTSNVNVSEGIENITEIETDDGTIIEISADIKAKWGTGYSNREYLNLEKFYIDMGDTYEIVTPQHKALLKQLSKLNLKLDNLLESGEYDKYAKLSTTYDNILKSAGFRPADRKSGAEATGIYSFGQVWAEVEKEGFIPPNLVDYPKDDLDYMLLYYIQFTQRLVGKSVSIEPPENWKKEIINGVNDDGK